MSEPQTMLTKLWPDQELLILDDCRKHNDIIISFRNDTAFAIECNSLNILIQKNQYSLCLLLFIEAYDD